MLPLSAALRGLSLTPKGRVVVMSLPARGIGFSPSPRGTEGYYTSVADIGAPASAFTCKGAPCKL